MRFLVFAFFAAFLRFPAISGLQPRNSDNETTTKDAFLDDLVSQMTVPELVLQLHLMFGDNIVGPKSQNELYDFAMQAAPDAAIGNMHDWYPMNKSHYNEMQRLSAEKARLNIPFMHFGECLHGVGSYKQSMFPQTIGLAATFDKGLIHRVGRAIGTEARAIGVHACLSPVLDLGKEPRFGRLQEAWGEDKVLTSLMGVAYASGLSKNGSWSDPDAVVPVMKHFAAAGAPQSGLHGAPWMGRGNREVLSELLMPFKAVVDLGGVRGVMMAYNELDDVPAHVSPMLYQALEDWGFDGFVMGDDLGVSMLSGSHKVSGSDADTLQQWFNAGGMIQFYDYSLQDFLNITSAIVSNGTVPLPALQSHVRKILSVKYDLGLFTDPNIPESIDPQALTDSHVPLTLEAAQKSIVLMKNDNSTLPLKPVEQNIKKIALIGPFIDTLNYGDYSGTFGASPTANSSTLQQALLSHLSSLDPPCELATAWGANHWLYNAQYPIPAYHLSPPADSGLEHQEGLLATYYATTSNYSTPLVQTVETPFLDWGLYPPPGLPSNNFSATWTGTLTIPSTLPGPVSGYLGLATSPNTTSTLHLNDTLLTSTPLTPDGTILPNIEHRAYTLANATLPPPASIPFTFVPGACHEVRITYTAWNLAQKVENVASLNAQLLLFWNLVPRSSPLAPARAAAASADAIILHLGSAWSSDGEGADRASLSLPPNQTALADAVFAAAETTNTPVILVLTGARPLAIPEYYARAHAVLATWFPGQSGGRAVADVLVGAVGPGGRLPVSVAAGVGVLPGFYGGKGTARANEWVDVEGEGVVWPFGWGLGYGGFEVVGGLGVGVKGKEGSVFGKGDVLVFRVRVRNVGVVEGGYVVQVYLLQRVSGVTQPVRQLVGFERVDRLGKGEEREVVVEVEVERYLRVLNRRYEWEVERGDYTFAVLEHGGEEADTGNNVTVVCE